MTVLKTRDISRALTQKGFAQSNSDHSVLIFYVEGRKTSVRTKTSFGAKEVGDSLISIMAKQVGLRKKDFLDLVDCKLGEAQYLDKLRSEGKVS